MPLGRHYGRWTDTSLFGERERPIFFVVHWSLATQLRVELEIPECKSRVCPHATRLIESLFLDLLNGKGTKTDLVTSSSLF